MSDDMTKDRRQSISQWVNVMLHHKPVLTFLGSGPEYQIIDWWHPGVYRKRREMKGGRIMMTVMNSWGVNDCDGEDWWVPTPNNQSLDQRISIGSSSLMLRTAIPTSNLSGHSLQRWHDISLHSTVPHLNNKIWTESPLIAPATTYNSSILCLVLPQLSKMTLAPYIIVMPPAQ